MDFNTLLNDFDRTRTQMQVENINKQLSGERTHKSELDKDDFLKILLTQLTHQDPTNPMEDREFIAQMAQFSSLEQMTNMNREFSRLQSLLAANQAISLIGKSVEILDGEKLVSGVVEEVSGFEYPQLLVNGKYYDISNIEKVR